MISLREVQLHFARLRRENSPRIGSTSQPGLRAALIGRQQRRAFEKRLLSIPLFADAVPKFATVEAVADFRMVLEHLATAGEWGDLRKIANEQREAEADAKMAIRALAAYGKSIDAEASIVLGRVVTQLQMSPLRLIGIEVPLFNSHAVAQRGGGRDETGVLRGFLIRAINDHLPLDIEQRYSLIAALMGLLGHSVSRQLVRGIVEKGAT